MRLALFLGAIATNYVDGAGCSGGYTYDAETNPCDLTPVACDQDACEAIDGDWVESCPDPPPDCDPLAPSPDDPSCTGPPKGIDRFGKKMYARKLVARDKPQDNEDEGVFCHVTFDLCEGETMITQQIDSGFGDYYRVANAPGEWCDYEGTADYAFDGMHKCGEARSYSPVTPLNEESAQFVMKQARANEEEYECKHGGQGGPPCKFGMSELACMAPLGTEFLLSVVPDQGGTDHTTHYVYKPNFSLEPGNGPYTINFIGQGVSLTEINIGIMSALLQPFASDGSFSTIKEVNYLWANSYWSNAAWIFEPTDSDDLAREAFRQMGQYGVRFNLMNAISRERVPEAVWPRIDYDVIGDAFKIANNATDKDPNIKWFVVGSSGFKKSMYPFLKSWGYDLYPCSDAAADKGYPQCGPNSLYNQEPPGAAGLKDRERSQLFQFYEDLAPVPGPETWHKKGYTSKDCTWARSHKAVPNPRCNTRGEDGTTAGESCPDMDC